MANFGARIRFTAVVCSLWLVAACAHNQRMDNYANQLSMAAGNGPVTTSLGLFYYLGLASLLIDGVLLLMAYNPLRAHSKKGWNLLFLAALVNLVYGIIFAFDNNYGNMGNLVSALIGSAIAFYFLFQVRDYYTGAKSADSKSSAPSPKPKA